MVLLGGYLLSPLGLDSHCNWPWVLSLGGKGKDFLVESRYGWRTKAHWGSVSIVDWTSSPWIPSGFGIEVMPFPLWPKWQDHTGTKAGLLASKQPGSHSSCLMCSVVPEGRPGSALNFCSRIC